MKCLYIDFELETLKFSKENLKNIKPCNKKEIKYANMVKSRYG